MRPPLVTRAYANYGRWVVECHDRAAGELRVGQSEWRCPLCRTEYHVIWPAERRRIERLLSPRPIANQNWLPGETLADLLAENIEHGLAAEEAA